MVMEMLTVLQGWVGKNSVCARSDVPLKKSHIMSHTAAGFLSLGPQLGAPISSGKHFQLQRCKIAQIRLVDQI